MEVISLELPNKQQLEFQIALVEKPAIESDFMVFSQDARFQFKEVDKAERKLMGYFMIADLEIPRMDAKRGAYKVVFKKPAIDTIVENFAENNLNKNINENHQTGKLAEGVYVLSHWQLDSEKGIGVPKGFKTEADGSWFGIVKCENEEIYQRAISGEFKGFSIEGRFIETAIDKYFKQGEQTEKSLYNKLTKMKIEFKELFEAINKFFADGDKDETQRFEELLLVDGVTKVTIEPAVEVGAAIMLYAEDGTPIPAPIGTYELQDGKVIVVEVEGVVASVTEATPSSEDMTDQPKETPEQSESVKRLIERIEKVSEFEKQIADLKAEKESFKKETEFLHKENEELKTQFTELKQFSKETLESIKTMLGKEDSKEPVQVVKNKFGLEKENKVDYPFLRKQIN